MATVISRMAVNNAPSRASLLGIASELRQNILEHVFAGSMITIRGDGDETDPRITTTLQLGVISACKQLRSEGQDTLASSTTLNIHRTNRWVESVPVDVTKSYLANIQYVKFDVSDIWSRGLDFRQLPSLKVLRVRGAECFYPRPDKLSAPVDEATWLQMRDGNVDEEMFVESWYTSAKEEKVEQEKYPDMALEVENITWLIDILNGDGDAPFQVIVESWTRGPRYDFSYESETNNKRHTLFVELHFDLRTREVLFRQVVEKIEDLKRPAQRLRFGVRTDSLRA